MDISPTTFCTYTIYDITNWFCQHYPGWQNSFVSKLPGEEDTKTAGRDATGCLVVEIDGFEPTTPCLQSRCSSQLSYTPK